MQGRQIATPDSKNKTKKIAKNREKEENNQENQNMVTLTFKPCHWSLVKEDLIQSHDFVPCWDCVKKKKTLCSEILIKSDILAMPAAAPENYEIVTFCTNFDLLIFDH